MNDVQAFIDRQLGFQCRYNYDSILQRLVVTPEESFYGLQNFNVGDLEQDPPIFACRFAETSGYEHILALANEDGRVAIQDTSKVVPHTTLEGFQCHNNAVFDLAWMPEQMKFVTVSGDHTASLWDLGEGAPKRMMVFSSHTKSVKTAVFRPGAGGVFATGARDGHVLVWDARLPPAAAAAALVKPDNCLINCHSSFTPKTPGSHSKRARPDNVRATSITGLVFQNDTTLISCGECDGNIKVWDLRKNYNIYKREPLPKHSIPYCGSSTKNGYTNLIVDDARIRLYASCMDNVIYCYNILTYNVLPEQRYIGHENSTFYIKTSLSPDCRYLVSGSSDKNAYIWNVKYSRPVARLTGHSAEVTCATWARHPRHAAARLLVTCSDDARHNIWRLGPELYECGEDRHLRGRAETVPHTDIALPQWGKLDNTPKSVKRKKSTTPSSLGAKRPRHSDHAFRKTKRCLTDMMNASKEGEDAADVLAKRLKPEQLPAVPEQDENQLPAGVKRHTAESEYASPPKTIPEVGADWSYSPKAGSSFMTPTKNLDTRPCKRITPRKRTSSEAVPVSPQSPKLRVISYSTPTKGLPNYVMTGEAPHLRLMSPAKKKQETTNWLTLIVREKHRGRTTDAPDKAAPLSPKENLPPRRSSVSDRTPKAKKSRTLLNYFSVTNSKN